MKPQLTAKQREAGMVKELEKEDFYGKKKMPVIKASIKVVKVEKPLSAKEREAGMIKELEKEDFYGDKKKQEKVNKMAKEAIEGYIEVIKEQGEEIPDDNRSPEYSLTIVS